MVIKTATIIVLAYDNNNIMRVLTQRRSSKEKNGTHKVEIPGGHIDSTDTSPKNGVTRELYEETGLKININNVRKLYKERNHGVYYTFLNEKCNNILITGSVINHYEISRKPPKYGKSYNNSDKRYKWYNLYDFRIDNDLWHYTKKTIHFAHKYNIIF
jgi:8-oxo-dGTP pyrophosphatase MutT (NUDIX family)